MAYEIPYDSNYGEWYGQPQDVTRLSATLEQSLDEDGNPIGIITASWNMPDNGGTFVAQLSTDGTEYHIAETNIRKNSVIFVVEPNTDYYLKIITVLGSQQSSGVVSSLLSSGVTIVPPTPIVVAVQGGMQINVGSVPFGYNVVISISDGTDTHVLYTTNMITIYNGDAGTYTVSTAYSNASNDVGPSSASVSVTVSELATADDYVEKTSADYIKSASVNQGGDTLTLTKGDDTTVTFQGGGGSGGGGGAVQTTVLWESNTGTTVGTITLNDSYKNYDFFAFNVAITSESPTSGKSIMNPIMMTLQQMEDSKIGKFSVSGWGQRSNHFIVVDDTTFNCTLVEQNQRVYKIYGIKIGGGPSLSSQIASLEARIQALESQLS